MKINEERVLQIIKKIGIVMLSIMLVWLWLPMLFIGWALSAIGADRFGAALFIFGMAISGIDFDIHIQ